MTDTLTNHWDHVYATKADDRVSWFEPSQEFSLELIADRALLELRGSAFGVFNLAAGVSYGTGSARAGRSSQVLALPHSP